MITQTEEALERREYERRIVDQILDKYELPERRLSQYERRILDCILDKMEVEA